jgi:uncharacterized protein YecE (DUF72 family)
MTHWIGTSGFQYPEWKGVFYPEDLSPAKMLPYYAERFATTEINYSFHRIPNGKTIDGWCQATPEHFKFALKAPQKVTHFARLKNCEETINYFYSVAASLERKLGPVLFQLPPQLKADADLLRSFLALLPASAQSAFEFRHDSWLSEDIFALLHERNVALCIADSEKLATPAIATANYGYLRLRREDYTAEDVSRWARKIVELGSGWSDAYVYFKHEESGTGPRLAQLLAELLQHG